MDSFPAAGVGDVGAVTVYGFKTVQVRRQLTKSIRAFSCFFDDKSFSLALMHRTPATASHFFF